MIDSRLDEKFTFFNGFSQVVVAKFHIAMHNTKGPQSTKGIIWHSHHTTFIG